MDVRDEIRNLSVYNIDFLDELMKVMRFGLRARDGKRSYASRLDRDDVVLILESALDH